MSKSLRPSLSQSSTFDIAEAVLSGNTSFLHDIITKESDTHQIVAALEGLATLHVPLTEAEITHLIDTIQVPAVNRTLALHFTVSLSDIHDSLLHSSNASVAEAAIFAAGESGELRFRSTLESIALEHDDPLCRESAVAALGSIGDPRSLSIVLRSLQDRPTIRRRAVVALSAFDDPAVELALEQAKSDRDFQVRTLAEDLLRPPTE
jgi:HEAT repeat protein